MTQKPTPRLAVVASLLFGACVLVLGCTTSTLTTAPTPAKCQVTVAGSVAAVTSGGGSATVSVSAQPECAWSASAESSWIADINPKNGQGNASLEVVVAANPTAAARVGNIKVNNAVVPIPQDAAPCQFTVVGPANAVPAAGGTTAVTVTTMAGCTWTASSSASWLTMASGGSGSNSGSATFAAAANPGGARIGEVTVAGQTINIAQGAVGCTYALSPGSESLPIAGGARNIGVTSAATCTWTASTDATWIAITGGTSGSGSGSVSYSVAANAGAARSGTIRVGDQSFSVSQDGTGAAPVPGPTPPGPCTYVLGATAQGVSNAAGPASTVSVTAGATCTWTATTATPWIAITSGGSGTGNGSVAFSVVANPGALRTGTLTIAGQTYTVTQAAAGCSFTIGSSSATAPDAGGAGTPVGVTANISTCAWTATSNDAWLTITSGGSGTGNGSVSYSVGVNTAAARSGTLTMAGRTFTVNQAAAPCSYSLGSTSASVPSTSGAATPVGVTTNIPTCTWTATSNDAWLTITSGSPGTGSGSVGYSIAANTGLARTGTLTIAGRTFTVNQAAPPCSYSLGASSASIPSSGGAAAPVGVTTNLGICGWTAMSNDGWLTITSGTSGAGGGSVGYSAAVNVGPARSGTLTIAGLTFTANQATGCTYSLSRTFGSYPAPLRTTVVTVTASSSACTWTSVSNAPWIVVTSGSNSIGTADTIFDVTENTTGVDRVGTLTIAGQTYTVSQGH